MLLKLETKRNLSFLCNGENFDQIGKFKEFKRKCKTPKFCLDLCKIYFQIEFLVGAVQKVMVVIGAKNFQILADIECISI